MDLNGQNMKLKCRLISVEISSTLRKLSYKPVLPFMTQQSRTQRGALSSVAEPGNRYPQALIPNVVCQAWFQNVLGLVALLSIFSLLKQCIHI